MQKILLLEHWGIGDVVLATGLLTALRKCYPNAGIHVLAQELGIRLGKTHYCLKALIDKGWVKAARFRDNPNKGVYAYLLTPKGIAEKARVTKQFLKRKMDEFEAIKGQIKEPIKEVEIVQE